MNLIYYVALWRSRNPGACINLVAATVPVLGSLPPLRLGSEGNGTVKEQVVLSARLSTSRNDLNKLPFSSCVLRPGWPTARGEKKLKQWKRKKE